MASRLANLLVNIPKRKGQCYQAVAKLLPDRRSTTRKPSRSCCRYPRTRSNSLVDYNNHARSYSQPAMRTKRNCLSSEHVSRRNKSDSMDQAEEEAEEVYARSGEEEESTFYYDAPDKDRRLYESARELSTQDRMLAVNRSMANRQREVSEPETVQYELEATRPRDTARVFDVFDHFSSLYKTRDQRMVPHLQPSNLRPFGSTNTLISPTLIRSANGIKYPVYDTHEAHSTGTVAKPSDRDTDDMQRRGFSTFKSLRAKENPGYRPTNKMSQLVRPRERHVEESEEKTSSDKVTETSAELRKCNEIIEKHRELNAKYYAQKSTEPPVEHKSVNTTTSFVEKYKFPKPNLTIASNTEREKLEIGNRKAENTVVNASQYKECKQENTSVASEQNQSQPWPEPDVRSPATVRSTLPINILQSTASPEDSRTHETVRLGPNQKLAVPWPSYSERMVPRKRVGLNVVYPALSSTDVMKPPPKGDCLDTRSHMQTRGISTDNNFRIDGGLFSNDCRLRHVLCKREVVDSILQKSNAFKENLCRTKISSSSSRDFSSVRYSSSWGNPFTTEDLVCDRRRKRVVCKVAINKNRYKRKHLPNMKASDCPCIRPAPLKDVKIKKLKPRYELADKPRICKQEIFCDDEVTRSDQGLRLKRRQLPVINSAECPCIERHMKDAPKIKKRTPRPVYEPPKICPEPCNEHKYRADKASIFKRKQLPVLKPSECPCPEPPPMKEVPSLQRLDLFVPEPKRVCPKRCSERHARADEGLRLKSRKLPRITLSDCPCEETYMKDVPRIKRLVPKPVVEPRKVCPVPCEETMIRADQGMEVESKILPKLRPSDCPCREPAPMTDVPPLDRLDLFVPEPRKEACPIPCSEEHLRADSGLRVKPKELPVIKPGDCPCIEQTMKDAPKLKRLIAKPTYETKKVCVIPCQDQHNRADYGLKITPKELPAIDSTDCPCPPPVRLRDVRPLDRLDLYVPQPARIRPKKCTETTPRADQGLQVKSKELPMISPGDCPCFESSLKDAPRISRLIPKPVIEPIKKCPPAPCEEVHFRADDAIKIQQKSLPDLTPSECPCPLPPPMKDVRPLDRLDLYVPQPPRIRPKTCSETTPRADQGLQVKSKELPKISSGDCPCFETSMKDAPKIKRLIPKPVLEPRKVCPVPCEEVSYRADHDRIKKKRKSLPTFLPVDCPCFEPKPMQDVPPLERLDLYVSEPKRVKPKKCYELIPRADASLKVKHKTLPIVEDADCSSPDLNVLKPGPKLTRPKFKGVCEPEKIPPVHYCTLIPRSDDDDWEYVVPEGCEEEFESEYSTAVKSSQKPRSSRLQPDLKLRRHFSNHIPHKSPLINTFNRSIKNNVYNGTHTCCFHTQRPSDVGSPVFPKSPFKDNLPWRGTVKNAASSTTNMNIGANISVVHNTNDEPECFFRRPISTSYFMQSISPKGKKAKCGQRKAKCAKFNLPGCSPRARTSCKTKPMQKKCVRQSSPYPSFSEVTDADIETMECECTKIDYLQPRHPIIRHMGHINIPPPHQGPIDPTLEDLCVRKKLGIPPPNDTAVCSTTITKKRLKQRDYLDEIRKIDDPEPKKAKKAKKKKTDKEKNEEPEPEQPVSDEICCLSGKDKKRSKLSPEEKCFEECCKVIQERQRLKNMTLWERIVDYFRARPDCPSPEEFKRRRLREIAEKAAAEAGLCVYDPKEMCKVKDLPKVITAKDIEEDCKDEMDKDEEDVCDDVVQPSAKKCKKRAFSCSGEDKSSKPDFPNTEAVQKVRKECKPKKVEKVEKKVESSICEKLMQCLSGGNQKRKYSTYHSGQSLEMHRLLNDLIHGDENAKEYLLSEGAPIIDALIDQGYAVMRNASDDDFTSLDKLSFNRLRNTDEGLTQTLENIGDSDESKKLNKY